MQDPEVRKKAASCYSFDRVEFDSKAELCYYIWLTDNGIEFTYQPNARFKYTFEGKDHFYHPDFIVEGRYVEIKGDHFFKEDGTMRNSWDSSLDGLYEAKHQCMLQNNVKILNSEDYNMFVSYVANAYGSDFIISCKQ